MARGVNTAHHPGRQPQRPTQSGGTASGWAAAGGGGTPPYNPNVDYLPVTGSPGMYYTPDRMMQVGIRREVQPTPTQEQLYDTSITNNATWSSPPAPDPVSQWVQANQPQFTNSYGPVGDIINSTQFVPS